MWLRRTKSGVRIHSSYPPKFGCSSFKDIQILIDEGGGGGENGGGSPKKLSICHRTRSVKSFLRSLTKSTFPDSVAEEEDPDPEIRIPGAEKLVVVYFTSLRIVRRTFEDCKAVRSILSAFRVPIDERDLSMDSGFIDELQRILGVPRRSKLTLPRVFIGGRYIGGVEDVRRLHESGELKKYVEGLPVAEGGFGGQQAGGGTCEACGGYRFVLCVECDGSHKCYSEKAGFSSCTLCNENGLIRCPSCPSAVAAASL